MRNSFIIFATHFLIIFLNNLISADEVSLTNGIYACGNATSELNEFMNECVSSPFAIGKNITCNPNAECILKCSINTSITIVDHSWIYKYDTETNDSVKLFDGQFKDDVTNGIYTATITLPNYYAGSYGCLFEYKNSDSSSKVVGGFKISQDEAVQHDGQCEKSSQCLTLNSQCLNVTNSPMQCVCPKDFPVQDTDENNNIIACFKYSEMGENCNIAEECGEGGGNATCVNNKCGCLDFVREVNGKDMCLARSEMYEFCYLTEQCSRYKHAECVANTCDCPPAYAFIDNQCKLSVASIIFIVVMSLCCLLSLLAIVVCCCKRNRGWGTWIMYILELKPPHQQLINEDKISQIDI